MKHKNAYSEYEKNFVIQNFRFMTSAEIAKAIGRTKMSVDTFKYNNGISKNKARSQRIESEVVAEIKALIKLAELTDNRVIRQCCKVKLKELSNIPKENFFSLENTLRR